MKTEAIKLNKDFKRLYYRGKRAVRGLVVVYASKNRLGVNRLGLTCGKAVGNAVRRNRAKRLMRESYRLLEPALKTGFDIVIVARSRAADKHYREVDRDVRAAFQNLELFLP